MRLRRFTPAFAFACFAALVNGAAKGESAPQAPEPDGYRMENYRAPVPATLKGATVVDTARAFEMWQAKAAIFIDALPQAPRPDGLPKNAVWRDKPRFDVPGGVWLPDTGYGALSGAMQRYFESSLARASGGDRTKPLLFYCLADCWMSWNAAKRALSMGYGNIYWYPEGTDGWEKAGHPLEEKKPELRG